jgi:hypothetical protein
MPPPDAKCIYNAITSDNVANYTKFIDNGYEERAKWWKVLAKAYTIKTLEDIMSTTGMDIHIRDMREYTALLDSFYREGSPRCTTAMSQASLMSITQRVRATVRLILRHPSLDVNRSSCADECCMHAPLYRALCQWEPFLPITRMLVQHKDISMNEMCSEQQKTVLNFFVQKAYSNHCEKELLCGRQLLNHTEINVRQLDGMKQSIDCLIDTNQLAYALIIHGRV